VPTPKPHPSCETDQPDPLAPYREAIEHHGARFEALLWNSAEAQVTRFDAILGLAEPRDAVIADIGCGLADLAERLDERHAGHAGYVGVDALPELVERAEARARGTRNRRLVCADFARDEDLFRFLIDDCDAAVFAFSGSLNTFEQRDAEAVLDRAWAALRSRPVNEPRGQLVFNFLSDRHHRPKPAPTGPARRFDTAGLLSWAMARTPLVRFRQDHLHGHDGLIWMGVPDASPDARAR
jgi:hypothetical protein